MSTEWETWPLLPWWRRVTLIDGRVSRSRVVMRRKVHGEWQYRECTPDEEATYDSAAAW